MRATLQPGLTFQFQLQIPLEKTVPYLYPESQLFQEMPPVLATGFLVGLVEWACIEALRPHLDWPREQSLGTHVNLSHGAATPPGLTVTVHGTLERVEGRRLAFSVRADDGIDLITEGTHERMVVDVERFTARMADKAQHARVQWPGDDPS
ncbi:MAG: thioesterase family protein [Gammaproteobacteria bacterium]|nr:thioesterase family protein [Gammaproteobacteria bacterium]NIR83896.1 thioesterase family protein [Gammaproteobacteria bacterium]NIR90675.1 thioesterase family protein [Gammaproteobacteria bacterium]NIV76064.1 thioesterase [Gammaproteobacteria bacterium]